MSERVYLDWNATAPLRPEARAAMLAALDASGNPSSVHGEGRAARRLIEQAREQVAALVGAKPQNVVFTSGGTEANMLALSPATGRAGQIASCGRLLVAGIEHPSVLAGGRFAAAAIERVAVTAGGHIDLVDLRDRLAASHPGRGGALVSLMQANNETGVVQPVSEAAALVHKAGGLLHVDAIQAGGRISIDINGLGADFMTLSGHKLGGPKGVGALIKRDEALHLDPLIKGGGQERSARAGTENVAAIAGFGAAAAAAQLGLAVEQAHMRSLQDRLEAGLLAATTDAIILGTGAERLPNTTLVARPGMKAETAVIAFDLEGVALSAGAACSSGKVSPSHVLAAMGVPPELARGAIRVSLGRSTTESEINQFLAAWIKLTGALTKGQAKRAGIAA
jgi:cysteine desulfurase